MVIVVNVKQACFFIYKQLHLKCMSPDFVVHADGGAVMY